MLCLIVSSNWADAELVHGKGAVVLNGDEFLVIERKSLLLERGTGGLDRFGVVRPHNLHPIFDALGFGSTAFLFACRFTPALI